MRQGHPSTSGRRQVVWADNYSQVRLLGDVMASPKSAQEPSMEEILASIRRIISDDDAPAEAVAEAANAGDEIGDELAADAGEPMSQDDLDKLFDSDGGSDDFESIDAEEDDDVLELTEELEVSEPEDVFDMVEAEEDAGELAFVETAEPEDADLEADDETDDMVSMVADTLSEKVMGEAEHLLSPTVDNAVHSAFNNLASTILTQNARTLEDLVKEMLRPMMKSWLDQNLPNLVERLVRQEIERVSRGR